MTYNTNIRKRNLSEKLLEAQETLGNNICEFEETVLLSDLLGFLGSK